MLFLLLNVLSFLVAIPFVAADYPAFNNSQDALDGRYGKYPIQRYISDPELRTPVANVLVQPQEGVSPKKYIMWAPGGAGLPITGPMMLDAATLNTVWQGPVTAAETIGTTVQTCNNTDYITSWSGRGHAGGKAGMFHIYDTAYELVYNVSAKGGLEFTDAHEIFLTPQCTAVFSIYQPVTYDLSAFNISDGWLYDCYFQEVDLASGELLFQWRASDHIPLADAVWMPGVKHQGHSAMIGYDFFHINSMEKDFLGNFLISGRHTNALYYISGATGNVIWTLGGIKNDFKDLSGGRATDFSWQHHARWVDPDKLTMISLFDDRNTAYHHDADPIARGMVVKLDYEAKTATLTKEWRAEHDIKSKREGSMQVLLDSPEPGNAILGYGHEPAWTEFSPDGRVLWDVTMGPLGFDRETMDNYRSIKVDWTGAPKHAPKIAPGPEREYTFINKTSTFLIPLVDEAGNTRANNSAYFSWNGATEVYAWVILASDKSINMTVSANFWQVVDKEGFETSILVNNTAQYIQALPVSEAGQVLGYTPVLNMTSGYPIETPHFDVGLASSQWLSIDSPDSLTKAFVDTMHDTIYAARQGNMISSFFALMVLVVVFVGMGFCMRRAGGGGRRHGPLRILSRVLGGASASRGEYDDLSRGCSADGVGGYDVYGDGDVDACRDMEKGGYVMAMARYTDTSSSSSSSSTPTSLTFSSAGSGSSGSDDEGAKKD